MAKQTFEMTFEGRPLVVEVGQVAKQANGAVVVRYGDTTVLSDRKSTRLNSSHLKLSRMPSSA